MRRWIAVYLSTTVESGKMSDTQILEILGDNVSSSSRV